MLAIRFLLGVFVVLAFGGHDKAQRELRACRSGDTRACIEYVIAKDARLPGEPSAVWMREVAWCESRDEADPPHDNESRGLYQFEQPTWSGTPWARMSILDPLAEAEAAAWVYRRDGDGREWACTARMGLR